MSPTAVQQPSTESAEPIVADADWADAAQELGPYSEEPPRPADGDPSSASDAGESEKPADKLLVADEVAELLDLKEGYIYALSRRGEIPTIRIGRYCRYRRDAIEDWLNDNEQGGDSKVQGR